MIKNIITVFLIFIITAGLFGAEDEYKDLLPEDYTEEEFPDPLKKLRRAEIIFAGSYPFSLLFTKIGYDLGEYAASGFSRSNAPQIFGGAAKEAPGNDETKKILITSLYVSAAFALIDYIIGEKKHKKEMLNETGN